MKKTNNKDFNKILSGLVKKERALNKLPALTPLQKAKLDHERAIEHLYYSSKIEGTRLTSEKINKAIHGPRLSPGKG